MSRMIPAAVLAAASALAAPGAKAVEPSKATSAAAQPSQFTPAHAPNAEIGIGYSRYEPAYYTGFAPRIEETERLHVHIGRGNQVRVTAVLSDRTLADYARDLQARRDTYRRLIGDLEVVLTQNDGHSPFVAALDEVALDTLVATEPSYTAEELRERNLSLMEQLNPGRVFRISMPVDEVIARWTEAAARIDGKDRLALADAMLPTRLHTRELTPAQDAALDALLARARGGAAPQTLREDYAALLDSLAPGLYPLVGDRLKFDEFTAIHPIGSWNQYVEHEGRKIPMYPSPGRRAFMTHQRTKTPDHVPTNLAYSYAPWLPYQHVGSRLHNSFHTLWWQMTPKSADFLPASIGADSHVNREGEQHRFLWILSRGPMSSGCTHVNLGHILELRQMLPTEPQDMFDVEVFITKSHLFDVFDIDGDLEPEVMGVKYFVAYSLRNKKPHKLRAAPEREAYYDWLYGGKLQLDDAGRGYFEGVRDAHFVGARAKEGDTYDRIDLYEADLEPQRYQFFAPKPIGFIQELRRAGVRRAPQG